MGRRRGNGGGRRGRNNDATGFCFEVKRSLFHTWRLLQYRGTGRTATKKLPSDVCGGVDGYCELGFTPWQASAETKPTGSRALDVVSRHQYHNTVGSIEGHPGFQKGGISREFVHETMPLRIARVTCNVFQRSVQPLL